MRILATICLIVMALAAPAAADRVVNSTEPIVVVDDITNRSITVISASSGVVTGIGSGQGSGPNLDGDSGNDNSRSGFGDDTTPGQGNDHQQSDNQGTDNPGGR